MNVTGEAAKFDNFLKRVKRQEESSTKKEESFEQELCKDKDAGEWFRLVAGEGDACRDVIQCTSSVMTSFLLHFFRTSTARVLSC